MADRSAVRVLWPDTFTGNPLTCHPMNTIPLVTLAVSRGAEIYAGKPTGKTAYRAESIDCAQTGSVLGRGYGPQEAIRDWKRRAEDDGYQIEEHRIATVKPRQVLTLAEFVADLTSPNGETESEAETAALDRETREQTAAMERAANRGGTADFD